MPKEYQHTTTVIDRPNLYARERCAYDTEAWDHEAPCEYCSRPTHKGTGECYPEMVGLDCTAVTSDGWQPKAQRYCEHCDAPAQECGDYCYQCENSCEECGRTDCTRHGEENTD